MKTEPIRFHSDVFRKRQHPSFSTELEKAKEHPELKKIVKRLVPDPWRYLDTLAEYVIARRFITLGCQIKVEVPTTVDGKTADLEVSKDGSSLYAHIKHLNHDENHQRQEKLEPRFDVLKKIARPFYVELYLRHDLSDSQAFEVIKLAEPFILQADMEDKLPMISTDGTKLGEARIIGPSGSNFVGVWPHCGMQEDTDSMRIPKLLSKANKQFQPGALNIIFLAWNRATEREFIEVDNILYGSACGYTTFNSDMKPTTVATGRLQNGFWSGGKHPYSQAVCWFNFLVTTGKIEHKTWVRQGSEGKIPDWFKEEFCK